MSNATCPKCRAKRRDCDHLLAPVVWECDSWLLAFKIGDSDSANLIRSDKCRVRELEAKLTKFKDIWTGMRGEILHTGRALRGRDMTDSMLDIIDGWEGQL
jgi:hypothetical protein